MKKPRRKAVKVEDIFDEAKSNNNKKYERVIKRLLREGYIPMKEKITDITDRSYERIIWTKPKIAA
jgi:hypothetical protein